MNVEVTYAEPMGNGEVNIRSEMVDSIDRVEERNDHLELHRRSKETNTDMTVAMYSKAIAGFGGWLRWREVT